MFDEKRQGQKISNFFDRFALLIFGIGTLISNTITAQELRINELMSSNHSFLIDADGESSDWFEILNTSNSAINLDDYRISDNNNFQSAWEFPPIELNASQYLMLFASGKDRSDFSYYWRTIIDQGDEWKYHLPNEAPSKIWNTIYFNDEEWITGTSGFGYGDNDDQTELPSTASVFIRKEFNIDDVSKIKEAILHIDYDDAFVAYINGKEIARSNITSEGPPSYYAFADNSSHEALIYQGITPEAFAIDLNSAPLRNGKNALAIQVHNATQNSSDLTAIPFLSLAYTEYVEGSTNPMFKFPKSELHTDFKLNSDGETLYLFKDSLLVDSLQFPALHADISYGIDELSSKGASYFEEPTPSAKNRVAFSSLSGNVQFSLPGGIYNSAISVYLSSDNPNDKIYYTTNNLEPTENDNLYLGPITINETTNLRAKVINESGIPGFVYTQSYFFDIQHDVPIISLVTDPANFFDDLIGIYVNGSFQHPSSGENCDGGQNFWQDWERPVHISMIKPDGTLAFEQNAGIKIFGGCSRGFDQKSLSVRFRKEYGKPTLIYKVFDELDIEEFSNLNLRNSGNDWNNTMMRDGLLRNFFPEQIDKQAFEPAVVYINGEYWGIHNIRERSDDEFIESHHDVNNSSVNIMEFHVNWKLNEVRGDGKSYLDLLDFIENNDIQLAKNFMVVKNAIDIENFALYQACNIALKNTDWPGNNVKFWSSVEKDNLWRWITYDLDFGFEDISHNTLIFALQNNGPTWPNPPESTYLLRKLIRNPEFRFIFINAFSDVFNTLWQQERVEDLISNMKNDISGEIKQHMNRWGGNSEGWSDRVNYYQTYANQRPVVVKKHIEEYFGLSGEFDLTLKVRDTAHGSIKLNSIEPQNYPWTGSYFKGNTQRAVAIPKKGYHFVMWKGPKTSFEDTLIFSANEATTLTAIFGKNIDYNDQLVINEIFYKNLKDTISNDWVELYNTTDFAIDLSGFILKDDQDDHQYIFPENTIIEGKDYLVVAADTSIFKSVYDTTANLYGELGFGFGNPNDVVRLYDTDEFLIDSINYFNNKTFNSFSYQQFNDNDSIKWIAVEGQGTPFSENKMNKIDAAFQISNKTVLNAYPNPIQEVLNIRYEIPIATNTNIRLINQTGRVVAMLEDGTKRKGTYQIVWNKAATLSSGMYILEIETNLGKKYQKVMKL